MAQLRAVLVGSTNESAQGQVLYPIQELPSAIILRNSLRVAEEHYAPWAKSRQDALENAVMKSWS
jgi:hypothetical protein